MGCWLSVVSHKSLVFGCSKNAPGQGVGTEPTRSRSVTDEQRSPGAFLEQPEGPRLFSRPTSLLTPHRPLRVCSSLAPRWTRKSLAAKHQPFVRHDTRQHATTATPHAVGPQLSVCGTTKYTKYTKARGHKPKARDAASGVSCADVPRLTPMGHPAYHRAAGPMASWPMRNPKPPRLSASAGDSAPCTWKISPTRSHGISGRMKRLKMNLPPRRRDAES